MPQERSALEVAEYCLFAANYNLASKLKTDAFLKHEDIFLHLRAGSHILAVTRKDKPEAVASYRILR
jgi:hypothetical protein